MLPDRPIRRVTSRKLGIAAIFDLTGTAVFRLLRDSLPTGRTRHSQAVRARRGDRADGAFAAATAEIQSAYHEVMMQADDNTGGVTLPA